jgi:hypothetical protein
MSSPLGTWDINGNGYDGVLSIQQVDAQGNLGGSTVFGDRVDGFWDDRSKRITFIRVIDSSNPSRNQVYTGYLMDNQPNNQTDGKMALAGSFEAFKGTGGIAPRPVYGWFAKPQVIR